MTDKLSDKDKALWRAAMDEGKPQRKQEENFADLLDQKPRQKEKLIKHPPSAAKPTRHQIHDEPLDKKIERQLKQGKINPDSTLDLHGLNQTKAHAALNNHIENAYETSQKFVLVITGKGKGQAMADDWITPGQGILKQKLPQWVTSGRLKKMVIDILPAHAKHGGNGAYYVVIRKKK